MCYFQTLTHECNLAGKLTMSFKDITTLKQNLKSILVSAIKIIKFEDASVTLLI